MRHAMWEAFKSPDWRFRSEQSRLAECFYTNHIWVDIKNVHRSLEWQVDKVFQARKLSVFLDFQSLLRARHINIIFK
jgi:hypothetical protein